MEIRCSKLARPMVCAGSLFFDIKEQEPGEPAKQGTAAGDYLRHLLEHNPSIPTHAENGVMFDDDMKFHAREAFDNIMARAQSRVLCEQRVDFQTRSGFWIRGQYDASYTMGEDLCVDDYKYGWKLVEVERCWQLLGYGIGEVLRRGVAFKNIRVRILQPRPHHEAGHYREWIIPYEELLGFREEIESRMIQIAGGHKDLVTGSHCLYCPAAAEACPAFNNTLYNAIESVYEFFQDSLTDNQLADQLTLIHRIEEIVKIKKDSVNALAVSRMKDGKVIKGWTTEASYSDRRWKKGVTPAFLKAFTGRDPIENTMMSPAKLEKLGVKKDLVNSMTERAFIQMKLKRKENGKVGDDIFGKEAPK